MSGNQAININPDTFNGVSSDINLTVRGSDWYWTVTAVMTFSTLAFLGLSVTKPRTDRVFHYITAAITMVAAIAYFTMASNLGWVPIQVEFFRPDNSNVAGNLRQIYYVRYIDWFITTPLLLLDLLLTSGLPWPTILFTILLDEIMVVTGLVGALTSSSYKFGYFAFGCFAFFGVVWNVVFVARRHAAALGSDVSRVYLMCGVWTIFLWFLYPIAWGLCEGGNVISPDSEAVFYGILDLLAKPVFGVLLLVGHRNIVPARLGLHIRDYDVAPASNMPEKHHHHGVAGTNGTGTTAATSAAPASAATTV